MDSKTIFSKTAKGLREASGTSKQITRALRGVLKEIDGKSTLADLQGKLKKISEADLVTALGGLIESGHIRETNAASEADEFSSAVSSGKTSAPLPGTEGDGGFGDLDFTALAPTSTVLAVNDEAEEEARRKAQAEKQANEAKARLEAEQEAKREAEEKAKQLALVKAKKEAEEKAKQEALAKAKREAEQRARKEAEKKARQEAEAKARAEAEARVKKEAEEKAKQEALAKERQEEEQRARQQAEQKRRAEAEAQAREEAEARAKKDADEKLKREAEERARREAEEKLRRQVEEKERQEAEERARREHEERVRQEAEEQARKEAEQKLLLELAEQAKRETEEKLRREAEEKAQREADEQARREAEEKVRREAEERARREAEETARREEFEQIKREAQEKQRLAAWESTRQKAEQKLKQEAEEKARREAEERIRIEADERAQREEEARLKEALKEQARQEAEEKALLEKQARIRREAEEDLRRETKEKAAREARVEARRLAADKAAEKAERAADRGEVKWGKLGALISVPLLAIVVGAIHFVSFSGRIPDLEKSAGEQFGQPVKIDDLHLSLFPPHWRMDGVTIGGNAEIKASRVNAVLDVAGIFASARTFKTIEIVAPELKEPAIAWLSFGRSQGQGIKVAQIHASNALLVSSALDLPRFDAKADIGADGNWQKITLYFSDKDVFVNLHPGSDRVEFDMMATTFLPPLGGALPFDDFSAKGILTRKEIVLTDLSGRTLGGSFIGNATIRWNGGWSLDGTIQAKQMDAKQVVPALAGAGRIDAQAVVAARAKEAKSLLASPHVEGGFTIDRGELLGVDLMHVLQGTADMGKTGFRSLNGNFVRDGSHTQLRQLRLDAGILSASGTAEVDGNGVLHGRFGTAYRFDNQQKNGSLSLSGTMQAPKFNR